jgi:hypothetical protein
MSKKRHALWDEDTGAFVPRYALGLLGNAAQKVAGARCRFCDEANGNSELLRLLNHVAGDSGTVGWAPCRSMPQALKDRFYSEWKAKMELHNQKKKAKKEGGRGMLAAVVCGGWAAGLGSPIPPAQPPSGSSGGQVGGTTFGDERILELISRALPTGFEIPYINLTQHPTIHRRLDLMTALSCYEGNISPHAIQSLSCHNLFGTLGFMYRMQDAQGNDIAYKVSAAD